MAGLPQHERKIDGAARISRERSDSRAARGAGLAGADGPWLRPPKGFLMWVASLVVCASMAARATEAAHVHVVRYQDALAIEVADACFLNLVSITAWTMGWTIKTTSKTFRPLLGCFESTYWIAWEICICLACQIPWHAWKHSRLALWTPELCVYTCVNTQCGRPRVAQAFADVHVNAHPICAVYMAGADLQTSRQTGR